MLDLAASKVPIIKEPRQNNKKKTKKQKNKSQPKQLGN